MTDRKWLPAAWLDELNPTLLASPDAFIERAGDEWWLRLPEGDSERDNEFYRLHVVPGQIVKFFWTEQYGDVTLTVHEDRSYSVSSIPAGTTHFYEYSTGAIADSIPELVAGDGVNDALEPGEYEVSVYTWSEELPYRFDVDADGVTARFLASAGVH